MQTLLAISGVSRTAPVSMQAPKTYPAVCASQHVTDPLAWFGARERLRCLPRAAAQLVVSTSPCLPPRLLLHTEAGRLYGELLLMLCPSHDIHTRSPTSTTLILSNHVHARRPLPNLLPLLHHRLCLPFRTVLPTTQQPRSGKSLSPSPCHPLNTARDGLPRHLPHSARPYPRHDP